MLSTSGQSEDPTLQQNADSLQQPRNDLQQQSDASRTGQSTSPQTVPSMTQDQLNAESLRVGDTGRTIQNSTSTSSDLTYHHNYVNAAWLWLLVPLLIAALLFWPQKKKPQAPTTETPEKKAKVSDNPKETTAASIEKVAKTVKSKKKKTKAKKK